MIRSSEGSSQASFSHGPRLTWPWSPSRSVVVPSPSVGLNAAVARCYPADTPIELPASLAAFLIAQYHATPPPYLPAGTARARPGLVPLRSYAPVPPFG